MKEARGDLHGGFEDEPARRHPRVGDREGRAVDDLIVEDELVIKKDVEIERARAPAIRSIAVEGVLDGREHAEEVMGPEFRVDQAGPVEERGLVGRAADRPGFAVTAHRPHRDPRHDAEEFDGTIELLAPGPLIGTTSDQAASHVALPAGPAGGRPARRAGNCFGQRRPGPSGEIVPRAWSRRQAQPSGSPASQSQLEAWPKRPRADSLPVRAPNGTTPACQAGNFSACPTTGNHPLSGMVRRERWGGHPGHDQGRRHSLPRVVAPQALFPVARRSGHRSGCHRAAVWCGPFPKVT